MSDSRYYLLFRMIALFVVTSCIAWFLHFHYDPSVLAKIDSMPAADYIASQRHLHEHSYLFQFFCFLVFGGFYMGVIDFFAYILTLFTRRKPGA